MAPLPVGEPVIAPAAIKCIRAWAGWTPVLNVVDSNKAAQGGEDHITKLRSPKNLDGAGRRSRSIGKLAFYH